MTFVLANTRDVLRASGVGIEMYQLVKLIEKIPKGPNSEVLRALERDTEKLHAGDTAIVAWLDDDKLYRALGLPRGQEASTLINAIRERLPRSVRPEAVRIHLLRGNIEQFLGRIDRSQPGTFDATTLEDACDNKDLTARDQCFKLVAAEKHAAWRKLVRDGDPGFDETIRYLADMASRETWPPW